MGRSVNKVHFFTIIRIHALNLTATLFDKSQKQASPRRLFFIYKYQNTPMRRAL